MRRCLAFLLLWTAAVAAAADWGELTRTGEWAFARGDFERAEEAFRAALAETRSFPEGDPRLETSLANLARLYEHRMRYQEAQPLYQLMLAARETRLGPDHPALLEPLAAIARTSARIGDTPTTEHSLERWIALAETTGAADPTEHWQMLGLLSRTLVLQERGDEALARQRRAVEVMSADAGADPVERAAQLETLAQLELLYGEPGRAEGLLDEALALRSEAGGTEAPAAALAAAAETALGAAEPELATRLAVRAAAAAEDTSTTIRALRVLSDAAWLTVGGGATSPAAVLGVATGDAEVAATRERLEDLVATLDEQPDGDAALRLTTVRRLAVVSSMEGDADAAIRWQREVVETTPGDAIDQRGKLVELLVAAGRAADAAVENATLIESLESTVGFDDVRLLEPLRTQQELLSELGRRSEARAVKKRVRAIERSLR
jgi:tetratricopeptide (TPR) repeat protein